MTKTLSLLCMALILIGLFPIPVWAHDSVVTTNVIFRTFQIAWGDMSGTAFAIDLSGKQYLVTAFHVVKGIQSGDIIKIFHEKEWKSLPIKVVGLKKEIDVAVLACSSELVPSSFLLIPSAKRLILGQQVFFLGYPFGWRGGGKEVNSGFPVPMVKAGVVSALNYGDTHLYLLDAHGNKGFSGGPVVFTPFGRAENELHVAGFISHYPLPLWEPLVNREGKPVTDSTGEPIGYIRENPGIVAVVPIRHVVELIDTNPIGLPLLPGE